MSGVAAKVRRDQERQIILKALAFGSASTWDVVQELGATRYSMSQARSRLRYLEALGLVGHKHLIGPPGFCTFEWFLTDAGSAAYEESSDA